MKKPLNKKKDLGVLLLVAALVRLWYYWHLHVSITSDTRTYLLARVNIFKGEVDPLRTPIYPWFLKLVDLIGPTRNFLHDVFILQAIVSFVSIWFFYKTAGFLLKTRWLVLAATGLYAISPTLVSYDMCVITESLSINAMVFFLFLMTNYLEDPSRGKAFFYTFFIFILVMLRPAFIYMYVVIGLFWLAQRQRMGLLALALNILLLFAYEHRNNTLNDVNAISRVSDENQLDLVAAYGIYPLGRDSLITHIIQTDLRDTAHFFFGILLNNIGGAHIAPKRVGRYVHNAIAAAPVTFAQKTLARGWSMQSEPIAGAFAQKGEHNSRLTNFILNFNPINFFCISLFLIISCVILIRTIRRTRRTIPWLPALLWTIATSHYLIVFLGARFDHQRLFVIAIPPLLLLAFWTFSAPPTPTSAPDPNPLHPKP